MKAYLVTIDYVHMMSDSNICISKSYRGASQSLIDDGFEVYWEVDGDGEVFLEFINNSTGWIGFIEEFDLVD